MIGVFLKQRKVAKKTDFGNKSIPLPDYQPLTISEVDILSDKLWQVYQKTDTQKFWKEYNGLLAKAKNNHAIIVKAK